MPERACRVMTPVDPPRHQPDARQRRVIVIVDLVESVRLLLEDESGVVQRWRGFIGAVRDELLVRHGGRLVKSLGDGLLLDFAEVPAALAAALELHLIVARMGGSHVAAPRMELRVGIHVADVVVDELDVFGAGVNLAARLLEVARPGETVLTLEVRDALTDGVHARFVDLGACFVKHLPGPVRIFRAARTDTEDLAAPISTESHLPVLAVVPFRPLPPGAPADALGDALADALIAALSRHRGLRLTSRLSTTALRNAADSAQLGRLRLGAHFLLTGQYMLRGDRIVAQATLVETEGNLVRWCGQLDEIGRAHV